MNHHRIEVTISHDWGLKYTFTCSAPIGTRCRMVCAEGCESWDFDDHEHEFKDAGECLLCLMINEDQAEIYEKFSGDKEPLRSDVVILTYEGDGSVTWDYEPGCKSHEWDTACLACGIGYMEWLTT